MNRHPLKSSFLQITLPAWIDQRRSSLPSHVDALEDRMRLVIEYSRLNVAYDSGGPFAAAVFETQSGRLVSIGVNRVIPCSASLAHAEMVAIGIAQQQLGCYDLGATQMPEHQLVVNGRPCAMCFGAIPWSGIRSVVIAASGTQIEELTGFDEGPIHPHWQHELRRRGIEVIEDVLADQACDVFRYFAASGGRVYNGRGS
ncbi:MAG: nucleoside deaminase [Pirellulaceae bacterium]